MKKVIVYIAMSLDGYISDENGKVHWLEGDGSEPENMGSYTSFIETIDAIVMGSNTYNQIVNELSPGVNPYKGIKTYVITSKVQEHKEDVFFINGDIRELIEKLKKEKGKNIWICGGANIINQLIKLNLIDRYCIAVIPTILGKGKSLFSNVLESKKLKLISTNTYNGIVDLVYERK